MRFADPWFLLLAALPPVLWWLYQRKRTPEALPYPALSAFADLPVTLRQRLVPLLPVLGILALMLVAVALARPQWGVKVSSIEREGIAIAMVIDTSTSMSALDLELEGEKTDRLKVAKSTFERFVAGDSQDEESGREGDAIGVVTFARYANGISPPTLDHPALLALLKDISIVENPDEDGTAIGDAMMLAVERLREAAGGRVMILMTDGSHNAGTAEPMEAANIAEAFGIRIYTIGVGSKGLALMPVPNRQGGTDYVPSQVFIDEFTLEKIADATGGRYFRATDTEALVAIYEEIDRLEKGTNVVNYHQSYREAFPAVLALSIFLLLAQFGLSSTWLRVNP